MTTTPRTIPPTPWVYVEHRASIALYDARRNYLAVMLKPDNPTPADLAGVRYVARLFVHSPAMLALLLDARKVLADLVRDELAPVPAEAVLTQLGDLLRRIDTDDAERGEL